MQARLIIICVVVVVLVALSATIYGLDSKNKSLKVRIDTLETRLAERENTIVSLEHTLIIQQEHMNNTTQKFQREYDELYQATLLLKEQQAHSMTSLLNNKAELASLYNSLRNNLDNQSNGSTYITVLGTINEKCSPTFRLVPIDNIEGLSITKKELSTSKKD